MNSYQKALIEEHSNLVVRTQNLHNYIYSGASNNDDRVEFANKCIQLASMKKYEEALRARIENAGITFENDNYFERITSVNSVCTTLPKTDNSNDCEYKYSNCDCSENCKANNNTESNEQ